MEDRFIAKRFEAIEGRQDQLEERVEGLEHNAKSKFDELSMYVTRTQGLAEKQLELLRELRTHMDSRFDQVNERFERVDSRIDELHRNVAELELTVKSVREIQGEHSAILKDHRERLGRIETTLEGHDKRFDSIESIQAEHSSRFDRLDHKMDKILRLLERQGEP